MRAMNRDRGARSGTISLMPAGKRDRRNGRERSVSNDATGCLQEKIGFPALTDMSYWWVRGTRYEPGLMIDPMVRRER